MSKGIGLGREINRLRAELEAKDKSLAMLASAFHEMQAEMAQDNCRFCSMYLKCHPHASECPMYVALRVIGAPHTGRVGAVWRHRDEATAPPSDRDRYAPMTVVAIQVDGLAMSDGCMWTEEELRENGWSPTSERCWQI